MVKMISDLKRNCSKKNEEQIIRQLKTNFKDMSKKQIELLLKGKDDSNNTKLEKKRVYKKSLGFVKNFDLTIFELEPGANLQINEEADVKNIYCITWKEKNENLLPLQVKYLKNDTDENMYILMIKNK